MMIDVECTPENLVVIEQDADLPSGFLVRRSEVLMAAGVTCGEVRERVARAVVLLRSSGVPYGQWDLAYVLDPTSTGERLAAMEAEIAQPIEDLIREAEQRAIDEHESPFDPP